MNTAMNAMMPHKARVLEVIAETRNIKTLRIALADENEQKDFSFVPGKFIMVSVFGFGESPLGIASSHLEKSYFEVSVADVGNVTDAMHRLKKGDIIGIRGPFGRSFPYNKMKGRDVIIVAGGTGIAPLRCLVKALLDERDSFGRIILLYGAKSKDSFCYVRELDEWRASGKIQMLLSTDEKCQDEKYCPGMVTDFLENLDLNYANASAAMCGPPKMIEVAEKKLLGKGVQENAIFVSIERLMHCGFGKCMHCNIEARYVCMEGPVFPLKEIREMRDEA